MRERVCLQWDHADADLMSSAQPKAKKEPRTEHPLRGHDGKPFALLDAPGSLLLPQPSIGSQNYVVSLHHLYDCIGLPAK